MGLQTFIFYLEFIHAVAKTLSSSGQHNLAPENIPKVWANPRTRNTSGDAENIYEIKNVWQRREFDNLFDKY